MKKLVCLAICAMAVMISCKNKGAAGDAADNDSTAVDSVMAELNDTTPLPFPAMKVFVTGGAGFLGINLVRHLLANGAEEVASYDIAEFEELFRNRPVEHITTAGTDGLLESIEDRPDFLMSDEDMDESPFGTTSATCRRSSRR